MDGHRDAPRQRVRFPVSCEVAGKIFEMQAANISRGGIMLLAPELLPVGTMAKLTFDLEGRGRIEVKGMIRHAVMEKGCGVEFVEVQAADQQRLSEYLATASENATSSDNAATAAGS
jgi:c-di-GMP-binding flagellar brake protein YcgR